MGTKDHAMLFWNKSLILSHFFHPRAW
jgi:hypothetical protein